MKYKFYKYQGAGNDFILLDNLSGEYDHLTASQIVQLCNRKFGVGADGLIKISSHPTYDFVADYYNADASKSFCGNGGRCAVAFAQVLGVEQKSNVFLGYDGSHQYSIEQTGEICISMREVTEIIKHGSDFELYTGSPHFVRYVNELKGVSVFDEGKNIRNNATFSKEGINVNFVEVLAPNHLAVRTYERGVEDETLACGTGVTACTLVHAEKEGMLGRQSILVETKGGKLRVDFERLDKEKFQNVFLSGPAVQVFSGEIEVLV